MDNKTKIIYHNKSISLFFYFRLTIIKEVTTTEQYISPKEKERIDFVASTRSGQRMLEKLDKKTGSINTKIVYSTGCLKLAEFLKKGLDEIVEEYKADIQVNMYAGFEK